MARSAETKAVSKKSSDDLDKGKKKSTKSFIPLAGKIFLWVCIISLMAFALFPGLGDGGGIKKKKKPARPLSAESKLLNAQAREGLSKGNIVAEMEQRRKERDQRTLYIKFPAENLPTSEAEIENIHPHVEQASTVKAAYAITAALFATVETGIKWHFSINELALKPTVTLHPGLVLWKTGSISGVAVQARAVTATSTVPYTASHRKVQVKFTKHDVLLYSNTTTLLVRADHECV